MVGSLAVDRPTRIPTSGEPRGLRSTRRQAICDRESVDTNQSFVASSSSMGQLTSIPAGHSACVCEQLQRCVFHDRVCETDRRAGWSKTSALQPDLLSSGPGQRVKLPRITGA